MKKIAFVIVVTLLLISVGCSYKKENKETLEFQVEMQTQSDEVDTESDSYDYGDNQYQDTNIDDMYDANLEEEDEYETHNPEEAEDIEIIIPGE